MAITKAIVKKLILEYIGGKKVLGNKKSAYAADKIITVQKSGSTLGNAFSSLQSMRNALLQNPIADKLDNITDQIDSITERLNDLPTPIKDQLTTTINSFQNSKTNFTNHTNILSGLSDSDDVMSFVEMQEFDDGITSENFGSVMNSDFLDVNLTSKIDAFWSIDRNDPQAVNNAINDFTSSLNQVKQNMDDSVLNDKNAQNKFMDRIHREDLGSSIEEAREKPSKIFLK